MVGYYRTMLEEQGVRTLVKNEYAQLAAGEIPFTQVYPELWVSDDSDYTSAVELIRSLRESNAQSRAEEAETVYSRSSSMQMALWIGKLIVVLLLVCVASSIIKTLL